MSNFISCTLAIFLIGASPALATESLKLLVYGGNARLQIFESKDTCVLWSALEGYSASALRIIRDEFVNVTNEQKGPWGRFWGTPQDAEIAAIAAMFDQSLQNIRYGEYEIDLNTSELSVATIDTLKAVVTTYNHEYSGTSRNNPRSCD